MEFKFREPCNDNIQKEQLLTLLYLILSYDTVHTTYSLHSIRQMNEPLSKAIKNEKEDTSVALPMKNSVVLEHFS